MSVNRAKPVNAERPRRFWREAAAGPQGEAGWPVLLDGRQARTPGRRALALPTQTLAERVAAEWAAQGESIDFASMPLTRLANTAIESVPATREAVAAEVARYAGSDLLCYHADGPAELAALHAGQWGPMLDWAASDLGLKLTPTAGIMHISQPAEAVERAKGLALELDDFGLTALASATSLYGSAVLAFAVERGRLSGPEAYELSRLDEAFQEAQWGVDEEAAQRTANRRAEAAALGQWFKSLSH